MGHATLEAAGRHPTCPPSACSGAWGGMMMILQRTYTCPTHLRSEARLPYWMAANRSCCGSAVMRCHVICTTCLLMVNCANGSGHAHPCASSIRLHGTDIKAAPATTLQAPDPSPLPVKQLQFQTPVRTDAGGESLATTPTMPQRQPQPVLRQHGQAAEPQQPPALTAAHGAAGDHAPRPPAPSHPPSAPSASRPPRPGNCCNCFAV
jgi:hypothetical protein